MYKSKFLTNIVPREICCLFPRTIDSEEITEYNLSGRLVVHNNSLFMKGERLYDEVMREAVQDKKNPFQSQLLVLSRHKSKNISL